MKAQIEMNENESEIQSTSSVLAVIENKSDQKKRKCKIKEQKNTIANQIPRGLSKSKRPWKTPKQKFSSIKKTIYRKTSNHFEKKEQLRNELRLIKEKSKEIKDSHKAAAIQKHQRRVENAERRLANERKAEIVQIIKNPSKLKRIKKKQLRMIEKRDLSQVKAI